MSTRNQLGTLLLERGLVTQEQLDSALEEQRQSRKSLGRVLIDGGIVSEGDLVSTLAARIGLEFVDLGEFTIDPSAVALISDSLARRFQAVPIGWEENRLVVAMADPSNVVAIDDIRTITGAEVKTVVSTRGAILEALDKNHRMFRKNRGMFYFVERLNRLLGEVAEKIAGTQMAIKTAFNAVQARHTHWRSSIFRKNTFAPVLAGND